jgi:hypothetical protein
MQYTNIVTGAGRQGTRIAQHPQYAFRNKVMSNFWTL